MEGDATEPIMSPEEQGREELEKEARELGPEETA